MWVLNLVAPISQTTNNVQIGFQTGSRCTEAVKIAIEAGYRHLDTAQTYFTETDIGDALAELIDSGKVTREEMFITTKVQVISYIWSYV